MITEVYSRIWYIKKEENLENTKKVVIDFEKRMNIEIRRQEKLDIAEKRDFRKKELLERYISEVKIIDLVYFSFLFFIIILYIDGI